MKNYSSYTLRFLYLDIVFLLCVWFCNVIICLYALWFLLHEQHDLLHRVQYRIQILPFSCVHRLFLLFFSLTSCKTKHKMQSFGRQNCKRRIFLFGKQFIILSLLKIRSSLRSAVSLSLSLCVCVCVYACSDACLTW